MTERVIGPTFSGPLAGDQTWWRPEECPETLPIGDSVTCRLAFALSGLQKQF